jgi:ABC-type metal ion transport system substrate-binding protein
MTTLTRILATTAMVAVGGQLFAQSDTGLTLDKKVLTLSAARKVIAAAEAEATKRGLGVVIVVVDDSGDPDRALSDGCRSDCKRQRRYRKG